MKKIQKIKKFFLNILKSKLFAIFVLGLILLGGLLVRTYKITNPVADWHSWRQADTASVSQIYVDRGIDLLHPKYFDISVIQTGYQNPEGWRFVEFPIYNAIHALFFTSFPNITFEVWGRLISIFCALITALFLFGLGRRTIGKWGGIAASFFYLFIPYNIYFTRVILPEPMGAMFVTGALFFFFEFYYTNKRSKLFLSALFFSGAMLIKPFAVFYAIPLVYFVYKKWGIKKVFKNIPLLLALDIALVPFFLWRAWINQPPYLVGIPHFAWAFNGDGIRFRPSFWRWIFGERLGKLILGDWGLIPFAFGVLVAFKKNTGLILSLFGMFLYVTVIATASVRHDYYQTFAIPAISWCLAQGAVYLWNQKEFSKWAARPLLLFSIVMMLGMGWYQIKDFYIVNHYEIVLAGQEVDKLLPKESKIIAPYNGDTAFLYQTKRFGWPVIDRSIEELIAQGAQYYVSVNKGDTDTQNFKKRFKTIKETDRFIIISLTEKI